MKLYLDFGRYTFKGKSLDDLLDYLEEHKRRASYLPERIIVYGGLIFYLKRNVPKIISESMHFVLTPYVAINEYMRECVLAKKKEHEKVKESYPGWHKENKCIDDSEEPTEV